MILELGYRRIVQRGRVGYKHRIIPKFFFQLFRIQVLTIYPLGYFFRESLCQVIPIEVYAERAASRCQQLAHIVEMPLPNRA